MASQITITGITGASPYNVFVCDTLGTNCVFVGVFITPPQTIILPSTFDYAPAVLIKIVDNNACIMEQIKDCT
jgi:uncharacterized membrane protein